MNLTLCAFARIYLCACIVLHGYFSIGKANGPSMKAAGSENLLCVVLYNANRQYIQRHDIYKQACTIP